MALKLIIQLFSFPVPCVMRRVHFGFSTSGLCSHIRSCPLDQISSFGFLKLRVGQSKSASSNLLAGWDKAPLSSKKGAIS